MTDTEVLLITYSTKPRGGVVHTLALAEALHATGALVHVLALGDPAAGFFRAVDGLASAARAETTAFLVLAIDKPPMKLACHAPNVSIISGCATGG